MRASLLVLMMLSMSLSGCIGSDSERMMGEPDLSEPLAWSVGDWWLYTFSTPMWEDDSARLVVTETDAEGGTAYMLGISTHREALRHAVLNHNPFLGRITHDHLSAYENGEAQQVLQFPLKEGRSWDFSLFGVDWSAQVTGVDAGKASITAISPAGQTLLYTYDGWSGFFESFIWMDAEDTVKLRMTLADTGTAHTGEVWFIRASDIFYKAWEHDSSMPDAEVEDSFFVGSHPSKGDYDEMIYWLDADMGGGSSTGTLTLRDHTSATALTRQWGPGASEQGQLGTIPYPSGDYTMTVSLSGDAYIRLIVAGGITSTWTL